MTQRSRQPVNAGLANSTDARQFEPKMILDQLCLCFATETVREINGSDPAIPPVIKTHRGPYS
jgi:hypothetical protein